MIDSVKEFHLTFAHPVGMIRWNKEENANGGLTKHRIMLRANLIQEELEELRTGCLSHNWEMVIVGIGDLEDVILGTVVELGITVDTLLDIHMVEGVLSLDLNAIPKEIRQ